jgi:ribulose-bisphosphate carboxylase small chain
MRFETFAYLPPLSPQQIEAQILFALRSGWQIALEFAENPSSADLYWNSWAIPPVRINSSTGQPEPLTAGHVAAQVEACVRRHPYAHVRVSAFNPLSQQTELSFIARTPQEGQ